MKRFAGICATAFILLQCVVISSAQAEIEFTSKPLTVQATLKQKVVLPCDYKGGSGIVRLWFFEKSVLFVDNTPVFRKDYFILNGNNLEVTVIGPEAAGEFICRLSDSKESSLVHRIDLLGPPSIEVDVDTFEAHEGGTIDIHCKSSSAPTPTITYAKENSTEDLSAFVKNGTLQITDVSRKNAGVYTCTAKNGYEPDDVRRITVTYKGRPDVNVAIQWTNLNSETEKTVEITCRVASEEEVKIKWNKGSSGEVKKSDTYEITDKGNQSTLRINAISKELFDNYTCEASNSAGEGSDTVQISSLPIRPIVGVTASDVSGELSLMTVSPYRVRTFIVTLKSAVGEPRVLQLPLSENEIADPDGKYVLNSTLADLTPNVEYEGSVVAVTVNEEQSAAARFTFKTQAAPKVLTSSAAGSAGALVFMLLVGLLASLGHAATVLRV